MLDTGSETETLVQMSKNDQAGQDASLAIMWRRIQLALFVLNLDARAIFIVNPGLRMATLF